MSSATSGTAMGIIGLGLGFLLFGLDNNKQELEAAQARYEEQEESHKMQIKPLVEALSDLPATAVIVKPNGQMSLSLTVDCENKITDRFAVVTVPHKPEQGTRYENVTPGMTYKLLCPVTKP